MKTSYDKLFRVCLMILLVSACLVAIIPVLCLQFIDYTQPLELRWDKPKPVDGRKLILKYPSEDEVLKMIYQKLHLPIQPQIWQIFLLGYFLGLIYFVGHFGLDSQEERDKCGSRALIVQAILLLFCVFLAFVNWWYFNVGSTTFGTDNLDLTKQAYQFYLRMQVIRGFLLPLFVFLCLDTFVVVSLAFPLMVAAAFIDTQEKIRAKILHLLEEKLALNKTGLIVLEGETVELVKLSYEIVWHLGFFPAVFPKKVVIADISLEKFFQLLVSSPKEKALLEIQKKLLEAYQTRYKLSADQIMEILIRALTSELKAKLDLQIKAMTAEKEAHAFNDARLLLQQTSDSTLEKFRQEIVGGVGVAVKTSNQDFCEQILESIKKALLELVKNYQLHCQPVVFPKNTRFYFNKGETTIVVVEQEPMRRLITFDQYFLDYEKQKFPEIIGIDYGKTDLWLDFPYIVFVVKLIKNKYAKLYIFYRRKSLQSIDDELLKPSLINISGDSYHVHTCGVKFDFDPTDSVSSIVEKVISGFWQSVFTSSSNQLFNDAAKMDKRLESIWIWHKYSCENPQFTLDVNWITTGQTLAEFVKKNFEEEDKEEEYLFGKMIDIAIDVEAKKLEKTIEEYFSKIKIVNRFSSSVTKELGAHLAELAAGIGETIKSSFEAITGKRIDPELIQKFNQLIAEAVEKALREDLGKFIQETPFESEFNASDLIDKIIQGKNQSQ